MQPEKSRWMDRPEGADNCPPGLEYLLQIDQLLVHQLVEVFEAVTGIQMKNKYAVKNSLGQQIYFAFEESSFCHRCCCGAFRGFVLHIVDNMGKEVIKITRPFQCCAGCCWCANSDVCAYRIQVEAPPGNVIGYARQSRSWWYPHMDIMDADMNPVLKVRGPCCFCQAICCQGDLDFRLKSTDLQTDLGVIAKQWPGCFKECCTRADNFAITFPLDLDVKAKATVLGAMFLLEFMFFEQENQS
ncbi:phospholipid scramblase 1-like [Diadema setosum]|uniref:phospholipid scramblase 1-like n=1 Tax=Diadema setosum TaxID=31175 RepID=UPI003B3A6D18